jgi:ATP diphosphatase
VFGSAEERAAGAQPDFWARIKAEERAAKAAERERLASPSTHATGPAHGSKLLTDVPVGLPALTRAIKLQDKAARVGFDWPDLAPVFAKMKEEIAEFEEVALAADPRSAKAQGLADVAAIEEELGDMLFVMANIARHLKLDPETALRKANDKFTRRFAHIERRLAEMGKTPGQSSLEEMDALWDEVRALDKARRV